MAEKDDGNARLLGGNYAIEAVIVDDAFRPAPGVGEMAEIGRRRGGTMTTEVERVGDVSGGVERRGEPGVSGGMLGESVGDLDDRPRRAPR